MGSLIIGKKEGCQLQLKVCLIKLTIKPWPHIPRFVQLIGLGRLEEEFMSFLLRNFKKTFEFFKNNIIFFIFYFKIKKKLKFRFS